jgi:hypothetical protein
MLGCDDGRRRCAWHRSGDLTGCGNRRGGSTTVTGGAPDPIPPFDYCFYCSGSGNNGGQQQVPLPPFVIRVGRDPPPNNGKQSCPAVPLAPSGVSLNRNMKDARIQGIFNPLAPLWFRNQVNYGGPWDYKVQGPQYTDFGNFNYGATGRAAFAPSFTLLRATGRAQRGNPNSPQFGGDPGSLPSIFLNPFGGTAPCGDDPNDRKMIQLGIEYARLGCGR